jgi:hypothetical protein
MFIKAGDAVVLSFFSFVFDVSVLLLKLRRA